MSFRFHTRIGNSLSEIPVLAEQLEQQLAAQGIAESTVFKINLCLDEVLTNIITYAFTDGAAHGIDVAITLDDDAITLEISDDGVPFDPGARTAKADTDSGIRARGIGGLGIHIVGSIMDEIRYRRLDRRNLLKLRKILKPTPDSSRELPKS